MTCAISWTQFRATRPSIFSNQGFTFFRLEIERAKASEGYDDLKGRVGKLEKDLRKAEEERMSAMSMVQDYTARLNTSDARRAKLEDENKVLN